MIFRAHRRPVLGFLVLGFAACGDGAIDVDDRIVGGVDLAALFAAPTDAEIAAVAADWAARTPSEGPRDSGSTETIRIDEMNQYGGRGGWYTVPDWCSA